MNANAINPLSAEEIEAVADAMERAGCSTEEIQKYVSAQLDILLSK